MEPQIDFKKLRIALPLFRDFPPDDVKQIMSISRLYKAQRGYFIFQEGMAPMGVFAVVSGMVTVRRRLYGSDFVALSHVYKGDVLGEAALVGQSAYAESAVAVQDSMLLYVPLDGFNQLRAERSPGARRLLRACNDALERRLQTMAERIREIFDNPDEHREVFEKRLERLTQTAL